MNGIPIEVTILDPGHLAGSIIAVLAMLCLLPWLMRNNSARTTETPDANRRTR